MPDSSCAAERAPTPCWKMRVRAAKRVGQVAHGSARARAVQRCVRANTLPVPGATGCSGLRSQRAGRGTSELRRGGVGGTAERGRGWVLGVTRREHARAHSGRAQSRTTRDGPELPWDCRECSDTRGNPGHKGARRARRRSRTGACRERRLPRRSPRGRAQRRTAQAAQRVAKAARSALFAEKNGQICGEPKASMIEA